MKMKFIKLKKTKDNYETLEKIGGFTRKFFSLFNFGLS